MLALPSLLVVLALALAPDPDLAAAEKAFGEGRYEAVLPSVHRALERGLPLPQLRRAHELEAMTDAAFDDSVAAIEAFRRLLGVDASYAPGPATSPKILGLLEEARRRGAIGSPQAPASAPLVTPLTPRVLAPLAATTPSPAPSPVAPAAEPSLTRTWWFWTGVGVLVVGAGASTWALTRPPYPPPGNLGTGQLR